MQASAAIEACIYHNPFTVVVFSQNVRVDGTETVITHRLDVHISQAAARPFVNICRTLFHPTLVEQLVQFAVFDGDYDLFPTFFGLGIIQRDKCFLLGLVIEQRVVIRFGSNLRTVYLFNDGARFHFGIGFVERAFFQYFGNEHAFSLIVPVEKQPHAGCRLALAVRIEASAGMRHVQFAQPFAQHF